MDRHNHYELAFEAYLRSRRVGYVAVDEARRAVLSEASVKSLDFIVSSPTGTTWLVDVKGRLFPSGSQKQYWKNWSTYDDLIGLAQWERMFGPNAQGLFVFAYQVCNDRSPLPIEQLFEFRDTRYGFVAIRLQHYTQWAKTISPRWNTLAMSTRQFRELAEPLDELLGQDGAKTMLRDEFLVEVS